MKIIFSALLLILNLHLQSQGFEGKIVFNNSYESKMDQLTDEQFTQMMGSVQEYYVKGNKYKSDFNGLFVKMQVYSPDENRLYNLTNVSDTLYWNSDSDDNNPVVDFEIKKNQKEILGFKCHELTVVNKDGKSIYYYSPKLKVNPKNYAGHKFGNWAFVMSKTKSLPLRIEIDGIQFSSVSEAVTIEEMQLEDSNFEIPAGPKKESPSQ